MASHAGPPSPPARTAAARVTGRFTAACSRYVVPQWCHVFLSLLGYLIYSMGNVLLADLMQFLLDSLNDSVTGCIGYRLQHRLPVVRYPGAGSTWSSPASPYRWRWC